VGAESGEKEATVAIVAYRSHPFGLAMRIVQRMGGALQGRGRGRGLVLLTIVLGIATPKDAVILIDSILGDAAPGTVLPYRKADIIRHCPTVRMDPHSPAIVDTLHNVELFANAAGEVLLIGIVGETYDTGCSLSAPVAGSCTRVVEEVLHELDRLGASWKERKSALDPGIW